MSGPNTDFDPVEVTPLSAAEVERMRDEALAAVEAAVDLPALKAVRTAHAGDRSPLALANREIGALPPQARKEAGQRVGQARGALTQALAARQEVLEVEHEERMLVEEVVDVTLPWDRSPRGARHPITTMSEKIADVFVAMGWEVAEGPVVEAEWLNFDALNLGADHPARTMQDTFWTEPADHGLVLRTQTSPVQARTMLTRRPPIYVVCPGRVFRTDEYDATHSPMFHQVEGLVVDRGITMAHLRGSLDHMLQSLFGEGITTRFRPSYFPFTEPSAEMDMVCFVCRGTGAAEQGGTCRTCRGEGWIELGGCGIVNPRVLTACGVDPDLYSGFAFGFGIDRMVMFRHGAEDLRDLFEADVRFTLPFGSEV
ncbi:phenylalanine--tRNA ligase alpha subunit [Marmoricola endophyticus]|uniref:Phenylalanine--tRNA ligase alpha subunit n=1 Tax=Marmoricola endophyticus TaxID=2040280 RepID=A0A917BF01_9ACTN|nr:phenylalanine--tRNA ligase subunit alpha [Marmoricola endophyticus]GGF35542.1 phenylalanine--tRNA ligase alpha subunit [Marmoricola endophyticus]